MVSELQALDLNDPVAIGNMRLLIEDVARIEIETTAVIPA
jgi:hypothetical protein